MLLRVPIEDDSAAFVEVEVERRDLAGRVELVAADDIDVAAAPFSLASAMDRVLPALRTILTRLRSAEHAPDEISMQVGLKIGGESGLVFAKASGEATFTATLTWRKPA